MKDSSQAKQKLVAELSALKQRVRELEKSGLNCNQAEEALRENEEKYRLIFENSPLGHLFFDEKGVIVECNNNFIKIIGSSREKLIGLNMLDLPDKNLVSAVQKALNGSSGLYEGVYHSVTAKKDTPTRALFAPMISEGGHILGGVGIIEDITERKLSEDALRESEEKYRVLFEGINDAVYVHDLDQEGLPGRFFQVNDVACRRMGYTRGELLSLTPRDITTPEGYEKIADKRTGLASRGDVLVETIHVAKDGRKIPVESNIRQFHYLGKQAALSISRDITERKQLEEELLRAHKLESLGVLAGGIAHDFNNLMTVVQGHIELAIMDLPPDHVSRPQLLTAMRSVDQTKDLTSRLITFSQGGGPLKEMFDVTAIIRDAVQRILKGTKVMAKFDFMKKLWPIQADDLQMKQCFYNLTTNAVEAMPEGGNLVIRAENALMPDGEIPDLKEGSYLKITFTDEGIGIPENLLTKIFDPYFTTKKMGAQKGLGLGLAVCYSVMKKHGGHITVKSPPGKGASFVLYLPAQVELSKEKSVQKTLSEGAVRILIMDDDPLIREIERAYLERMGYEVTEANDGQEAIDTYRETLDASNAFDLVLLDLTVRQGMGGQMAMERLLKIDPSIRAVVVSGFVDDPVIENYADYGFRGALKKPFKGEEMKSLLERILAD